MAAELLMIPTNLSPENPYTSGEFSFEPSQPVPEEIIQQALQLRISANRNSDMRVELATPMSDLVRDKPENLSGRIAVAATVAWLWHSDRQDGIDARKSISLIENLLEEHPELAENSIAQFLIADETKADGAKRDERADKVLTKAIQRGLREKAAKEGDAFTETVLTLADTSSQIRDKKMNEVRELGRQHGVDVKAGPLGKIKTGIKSIGQGAMIIGKKNSATSRAGALFIAASIIPEWGAFHQMKRHVAKELREKQKTS